MLVAIITDDEKQLIHILNFQLLTTATADSSVRSFFFIIFKSELKSARSTGWAPNLNSAHWETPSSLI